MLTPITRNGTSSGFHRCNFACTQKTYKPNIPVNHNLHIQKDSESNSIYTRLRFSESPTCANIIQFKTFESQYSTKFVIYSTTESTNTHGDDENSSERAASASPEKNILTGVLRSFGNERSVVGDGGPDPVQQRPTVTLLSDQNRGNHTVKNFVQGVPLLPVATLGLLKASASFFLSGDLDVHSVRFGLLRFARLRHFQRETEEQASDRCRGNRSGNWETKVKMKREMEEVKTGPALLWTQVGPASKFYIVACVITIGFCSPRGL